MREKLIELICEARCKSATEAWFSNATFAEQLTVEADHLIANGVTFATDIIVGGKWISVKDRLPEEHDSTFAKFFETEKWVPGMFRTTSNDVNACVEYEDGTRIVETLRTLDGKWNLKGTGGKKVTHWMPLPEPPKGE